MDFPDGAVALDEYPIPESVNSNQKADYTTCTAYLEWKR